MEATRRESWMYLDMKSWTHEDWRDYERHLEIEREKRERAKAERRARLEAADQEIDELFEQYKAANRAFFKLHFWQRRKKEACQKEIKRISREIAEKEEKRLAM